MDPKNHTETITETYGKAVFNIAAYFFDKRNKIEKWKILFNIVFLQNAEINFV